MELFLINDIFIINEEKIKLYFNKKNSYL